MKLCRWTVLSVILAAAWLGCQTGSVGPRVAGVSVTSSRRADVPVPPGLDEAAVAPRRGELLERAMKPLAVVLDELPLPGYLRREQPGGEKGHQEQADDQTAEPAVAAQREYLAARMAWREGQSFEAIGHLQSALKLVPDCAEVLRLLGTIYAQSGNKVRGAGYLEKAVARSPGDLESLYLLGRFAGEQGQWSKAIVTLGYAAGLGQVDADPAMPLLIHFFLGQALAHEGYDAAAVGELTAYLTGVWPSDRMTRLTRQLILLGRQRGSTWEEVGDAYSRLGQVDEAIGAYSEAENLSESGLPLGLVRRLMYANLRAGRDEAATGYVLRLVMEKQGDEPSLRLVSYLAMRGVAGGGLVAKLRDVYEGSGWPAGVASAIADLLGPAEAYRFLEKHLEAKPTERSVFERLLKVGLSGGRGDDAVSRVVGTTAGLIEQLPRAGEEYSAMLIEAVGDDRAVEKAALALGAGEKDGRPVADFLAGRAQLSTGRADDAGASFERALAGDEGLIAARVALAGLLLDKGEAGRAAELLEGVSDSSDTEVVVLRVRVLKAQGRPGEAIEMIDRLLSGRPVNAGELSIEKAKLQLATGDAARAAQTLETALDRDPYDQRLYEHLLVIFRTTNVPEATQRYQQLLTRMFQAVPQSRVARLERARVLVATGENAGAEPLLQALAEEDPRDVRVVEPMVELLMATGRQAEAGALIEGRLATLPEDQHLLSVALRYYRRVSDQAKTNDAAYRLMVALMADHPRDVGLVDALMEILTQGGAREKLETALDESLAKAPKDRGLLALSIRHFERVGDQSRQLEMTERLVMLEEPGPKRSQSLGILYLQQDQPEKARDVLREGLASPGKEGPVLVVLLGKALTELGQAEQVDLEYGRAIGRFPDHGADLAIDWAMACERRGDHDQAERVLGLLLLGEPGNPVANNHLGYSWANRGRNLEESQRMIQIALAAEPDNAAYLDSMGWVLYKRGRFKEAVTWLGRAAAAPGGEHPVIQNHLGDAMYRTGEAQAAAGVWNQARLNWQKLKKEEKETDPELLDLGERLLKKVAAVAASVEPGVADAMQAVEDQPAGNDAGGDAQAVDIDGEAEAEGLVPVGAEEERNPMPREANQQGMVEGKKAKTAPAAPR